MNISKGYKCAPPQLSVLLIAQHKYRRNFGHMMASAGFSALEKSYDKDRSCAPGACDLEKIAKELAMLI